MGFIQHSKIFMYQLKKQFCRKYIHSISATQLIRDSILVKGRNILLNCRIIYTSKIFTIKIIHHEKAFIKARNYRNDCSCSM